MNINNIELHLYLQLDRRQTFKCDARVNTSQREQYGVTVHLFIDTGRSLCRITFMPLTFTIYIGKSNEDYTAFSPLSQFHFPSLSRSFFTGSFGTDSAFSRTALFILCIASFHTRRFLYTYYTWETC
jgi:hypothetical protein